jgi:hypothetical protein
MISKDPLDYDERVDLKKIKLPEEKVELPMINETKAEVMLNDMAGLIQQISIPSLFEGGKFNKPRHRKPTYEECETLGSLVGMGLTLEMACTLLTPPLEFRHVEESLNNEFRRRTIYRRSQAKWLYSALQLLLTRPSKEVAGLIFVLKNRHSKLFDGNRLKLDITSAGNPLQLNSPEVLERARQYALENDKNKNKNIIDVEEVKLKELDPATDPNIIDNDNYRGSGMTKNEFILAHRENREKELEKEYIKQLREGEFNEE